MQNIKKPKILILRSNYYTQIAAQLTCGALLEVANHYLQNNSSISINFSIDKTKEAIFEILEKGDEYIVNFVKDYHLKNRYKISDDKFYYIFDELSNFAAIDIATTDGCLELPQIISRVCNNYDIIVVLGCVIRGQTTHYETVCNETNRAIMDLSISQKCVITNGILNIENIKQAKDRSGFWMVNHQNKGGAAVKAAIKTLEEINAIINKNNPSARDDNN